MERYKLSELSNQINLNTPIINFNTGSVYEPYKWQSDNKELQIAQTIEQRNRDAADARVAYNTNLAKLKNNLNSAENDWISKKEEEINNNITGYILSNDYSGLRNYITQAPTQLLKSNEYINRAKSQSSYLEHQKEVERKLNAGEIDDVTYNRWLEENQYSYEDERDNMGNVKLSKPWSPTWSPTKKANWSNIVTNAFRLVSPTANSTNVQVSGYTQNNENVTFGNNRVQNVPNNTAWGYSNQSNVQSVALEDIIENLQNIVDTDEYNAIKQDYYDRVYEYKQILNKLNNITSDNNQQLSDGERSYLIERRKYLQSLLGNNGNSFEDYCKKQIEKNAIAQNLQYTHKSTSNSSDIKPITSNNLGNNPNSNNNIEENNTSQPYPTGTSLGGSQGQSNSSVINRVASLFN